MVFGAGDSWLCSSRYFVQKSNLHICIPGFAGALKEECLSSRLWLRLAGFGTVRQSQEDYCRHSQDIFI